MQNNFMPQVTIQYKTYIKEALVEAFKGVFQNHKDEALNQTHVTIEYPRTQAEYPTLLIRFNERDIQNMGIGHIEHIQEDGPTGEPIDPLGGVYAFKHYLYHADLDFVIHALSSYDRDLISDTVVQTLAMGDLEAYTNRFFDRIYPDERSGKYPASIWHFININTDMITGGNETQSATPWMAEDELVYETSYRTATMGEFYSVPPEMPKEYVSKVLTYPYIKGAEPLPEGEIGDQSFWQPPLFE